MGLFKRLEDIISKGYYMTADGMQIDMHKPDTSNYHGNLIQGNADNYDKYFATFWYMFAHMYFADASDNAMHIYPNIFLSFETMMCDPMFYMFHKKNHWSCLSLLWTRETLQP